ncbi:MAG: hypothetical protein NZ874_04335 [Fimbriimonadales bacterium]|nr:hypothetical protein [Fimbriimonadales bacterium]
MRATTCGLLTAVVAMALTLSVLSGCAKQEQASEPPRDTATRSTEPAPSATPKPVSAPTPPSPATRAEPPAKTELPPNFPLPIYAGMKVERTMRTQMGGFQGVQVELIGEASLQAVAEFYEAEFRKRGLEVRKAVEQQETGEGMLVLGRSSRVTAGLIAVREGTQTRVTLSWSEKATEQTAP